MYKVTSSKQKLLNILKKDNSCTIKEIMAHFNISEIAVRKHIHDLEKEGFIQKMSSKQDIGRPYYMYQLTDKGHKTFPNQYEELPLELLRDLEELKGTELVDQLLENWTNREAFYLKSRTEAYKFNEKVTEVTRLRNEAGYMVEHEENEDGSYTLKNYNCPIINIANSFNKVCVNEKVMLENLFGGSEVNSANCITKGDHYCEWIITKPKPSD